MSAPAMSGQNGPGSVGLGREDALCSGTSGWRPSLLVNVARQHPSERRAVREQPGRRR